MRLALWTAAPADWPADLAERMPAEVACVVVPPGLSARADLHAYHLCARAECGFVYRALLREPGIVMLEDWNLHQLVHAETAGRGEAAAYRREMRRAHGPTGSFVATQVLRGLGGELTALTPLNARVLEASLGMIVATEEMGARVRRGLRERPLTVVPFASGDPGETARALATLAKRLAPRLNEARRALAAARGLETTLLGHALGEVLPLARELGQYDVPGLVPLVGSLFPQR